MASLAWRIRRLEQGRDACPAGPYTAKPWPDAAWWVAYAAIWAELWGDPHAAVRPVRALQRDDAEEGGDIPALARYYLEDDHE